MNKQIKHSIDAALNAKAEAGAKKPDASSEMSAAAAIDTLADIAKRSINLFRIYAEQLKTDDGYQVIDPRTVASTFQEFFQKAAMDPAPMIKEQCALWSDLALLWQRTAARVLSNTPAEPVIAPAKQDKRFKNELWVRKSVLRLHAKQFYLLCRAIFKSSVRQRQWHRSTHPAQDAILYTPVCQCVVTDQLCR